MKKLLTVIIVVFLATIASAQTQNPYPFTPAQKRIEAFQKRMAMRKTSLLKNVKLRSIGPTIMSGRVVDIAVNPKDPTTFYVAYATGGLWKTTDNGISFEPLFDNETSITIGAIAVDWKYGKTIWVGTGENNSSRSSYAGTGLYKSIDGGKTWQSAGLQESQHIGRIVLDPNDSNTVWVAAIGHLYSPNKERGVFKTTDGGKTWKKVLYIDENTGAIDLAIDPQNPNVLYAAMWYRIRRAWNFTGAGSTSGIYKSNDGGNTWSLITTKVSNFPTGKGVGRIGLAVFPKNPEIIYAVLDNQFHRKKEKGKKEEKLTREKIRKMDKEEFLQIKSKDLVAFMKKNGFPKKYTVKKIMGMVKENKITPKDVANYLEDAEKKLYNTPIIGTQIYRSNNGGKTWVKMNKGYINDMYYTYGYYFGQVRVDPENYKEIYLLGVPAIMSENGGKSFKSIGGSDVHGDFHALWIDPNKEGHLIIGNDGGINITYNNGKTWFKANTPAVGQFYSVAVDMEKPYNVYGGMQDNGVWYGPHTYTPNYNWYSTGQYPFKRLLGGDGMDVQVDTTDNNLIYAGFQFGYYYRINKKTHRTVSVKPVNDIGKPNLRFNWETPIKLSSHDRNIFYIGSNILYRSLDKGNHLIPISGDLTKGGKSGNVPFHTLTSIDESPLKFGLI
ncbi:MAG TPA: glycosyl hydrolase, partial [Ignavibacteria bacterium]|nr:glycosyl hydrolase [Ignavibacteria bacterium]